MRKSDIRRLGWTLPAGLLLAAGACSTAPLDERGSGVTVIERPAADCSYVGTAFGRGFAESYAMNNLRNAVGSQGGTHVVVTNTSRMTQGPLPVSGDSLTVNGIGYRCAQR
jgi:hypothetical protein